MEGIGLYLFVIIRTAAGLVAIALLSSLLSRYLTEGRKPLLPLKPFTCRPCLCFWINTISAAFYGFYALPNFCGYSVVPFIFNAGYGAITLLISFNLYQLIKSKYKIYD